MQDFDHHLNIATVQPGLDIVGQTVMPYPHLDIHSRDVFPAAAMAISVRDGNDIHHVIISAHKDFAAAPADCRSVAQVPTLFHVCCGVSYLHRKIPEDRSALTDYYIPLLETVNGNWSVAQPGQADSTPDGRLRHV